MMTFWKKLVRLWPSQRRRDEEDMQRELASLHEMARPGELGNLTRVAEDARQTMSWPWLEQTFQDLKYAWRGMSRNKAFTALAVASLALGIGANTAIFSIMETLMLRTLPVRNPNQLLELLQKYPGEPRNNTWDSASFAHIRDNNHVFSSLTGASIDNHIRISITGADDRFGIGEYVLDNYFSDFGLNPALGRPIEPEDIPATGAGQVAVISWRMWTNSFNQDSGVIGKRITVQDKPVTIVGIAPEGYDGLRIETKVDMWLPRPAKSTMNLALIGRVKPGISLAQVQAEMAVLYRFTIDERTAAIPDPLGRQLSVEVSSAANGLSTARDRYGKPVVVIMSIVGLLLLLACVNVASMLLARGAARQQEMSLRLSLGAGRGRIVRQLLAEGVLLSAVGTILGAWLASVGTSTLVRILSSGPEHEHIDLPVRANLHVLLFTGLVAVTAALLFGLVPAWNALRSSAASMLRRSGGSGETRTSRRFGKGLVAAQVALSLLLLSSAGIFVGNLLNLEHADLGFRRDHVLLVMLEPSHSGFNRQQLSPVYQNLISRLQGSPRVRNAAFSTPTPLQGPGASAFATAEGFQEKPEDRRWISVALAGPRYFETLGTPLLAGREFRFEDSEHPMVAMINQRMARYYFPSADPIGKHITLDHRTGDPTPRTYEIVGVVGDVKYYEIRETPLRIVYLPAFHDGRVAADTIIVRTATDPATVAADVRDIIRDVAPSITITRTTTLDAQIDATIVPERLIAALSAFIGGLGTLLVGIGLYGLLAYSVARRTGEIGIRMALGATSRAVRRMILRDTMGIVVAGLAVGIPLAIWGRSAVAALLQGIPVHTSLPFVGGAIGIVAVSIVAALIPIRRACRIDPMEALRTD
jgi:putative ABC transport system permease protein